MPIDYDLWVERESQKRKTSKVSTAASEAEGQGQQTDSDSSQSEADQETIFITSAEVDQQGQDLRSNQNTVASESSAATDEYSCWLEFKENALEWAVSVFITVIATIYVGIAIKTAVKMGYRLVKSNKLSEFKEKCLLVFNLFEQHWWCLVFFAITFTGIEHNSRGRLTFTYLFFMMFAILSVIFHTSAVSYLRQHYSREKYILARFLFFSMQLSCGLCCLVASYDTDYSYGFDRFCRLENLLMYIAIIEIYVVVVHFIFKEYILAGLLFFPVSLGFISHVCLSSLRFRFRFGSFGQDYCYLMRCFFNYLDAMVCLLVPIAGVIFFVIGLNKILSKSRSSNAKVDKESF